MSIVQAAGIDVACSQYLLGVLARTFLPLFTKPLVIHCEAQILGVVTNK